MSIFTFRQRIVSKLSPYRAQAILILLGLLLEMGFTGSVPLSFKFLIDNAIIPRDSGMLFLILGLLAGGVVLVSLAGLGRDYLYAKICAALLNDFRKQLFSHLQRLSLEFHSRTTAGNVLARFSTDLAAVENAITAAIPWAVLPTLDLLFSAFLLFTLDWRLALLSMLVFPLSLLGPRIFAPRASAASYERKQQESHVITAVQESLDAHTVVKAFGLEPHLWAHFQKRLSELAQRSVQVSFLSALVERSAGSGILALQVLIIGVGVYMTFNETLTLGSLVSFQSLFLTLSWSLSYVTQYVPTLVQASGGLQRIEELLNEAPQIVDRPDAAPLPHFAQCIAFEEVSFGYTDQALTLEKITFTIHAGESVAFVGASGSGKSTVLKLLARFYNPTTGRITIDGQELQNVTQDSLRAQLGLVLQDSFLFNTTVRENIRLGKSRATDAEVELAGEAAEVMTFVTSFPQGYDTQVGERGGRLSGGQRQRVAIARALLRDPAILLLDEATSALDAETELAINATLARVAQGRTVVSVTHRLASVLQTDRIFVLSQGRLVEQGAHEELLAREGLYAQLWRKQTGFVVSGDGSHAEVEPQRLRAIAMLAELDELLLQEIARSFVTERFPADRTIFREDDPGDKFYIIVRGEVSITTSDSTGQEQELGILQDGDYFGEIALLRDLPRTATVRTRVPSLLLSLQRHQLFLLMEKAPHLQALLERSINARLEESTKAKKT
jgi:ATP-binding cassette subfamily B protein